MRNTISSASLRQEVGGVQCMLKGGEREGG